MSGVSPRSSVQHGKSSARPSLDGLPETVSSAPSPFSPLNDEGNGAVPQPRRGSLIASANGRRGSGAVMTPSGQTIAYHTRTQDDMTFPAAEKKTMADHLRKYEALFTLTPQRMRMIVHAFEEVLDRGLQKDGQMVPMIPTFVFGYPEGDEVGEYLALDLGGTNLRVCLVTLKGEGKFEITQTKYRLTEEQKQEDGQKL